MDQTRPEARRGYVAKMRCYTPNYRCKTSLLRAFVELLKQMAEYRWQIFVSIKNSIYTTYKQDVLGVFWSIVMPLIPMGIYIVLAHIKVFKTVDDMPFVFYIAVGMTVWLLMATTIHTGMHSIKKEKAVLKTTTYPIFVALLGRLGEVLHDTLIRLVVVAVVVLIFDVDVTVWSVALFGISLLPAFVFGVALGMIFAIADLVVQDVRRVVTIALRYGLFVSSVIFPFPQTGLAAEINKINVFNTYVNASRDLLYHGVIKQPLLYSTTVAVTFALFLVAAKLVYSMDFKVREYL